MARIKEVHSRDATIDFRRLLRNTVVACSVCLPGATVAQTHTVEKPKIEELRQIFENLTVPKGTNILIYKVKAIAQKKSHRTGYILDGAADDGRWYQAVLAHYAKEGFEFSFEVYNERHVSIIPNSRGSGSISFSGPVRIGDDIELWQILKFGYMYMGAKDMQTGAIASITLNTNASEFVSVNQGNNTTDLMVEIYSYPGKFSNSDIMPQTFVNLSPSPGMIPQGLSFDIFGGANMDDLDSTRLAYSHFAGSNEFAVTYDKPRLSATVIGCSESTEGLEAITSAEGNFSIRGIQRKK